MSNNIVALSVPLKTPDMNRVLAAASAYSMLWEKRTFEHLPLLHTSVERHCLGFISYSDNFEKNAVALIVGVGSESIEELLETLRDGMVDPDEEGFLFDEARESVKNIGRDLDALLACVDTATKSMASIPVYNVERDRLSYLATQERLNSNLQVLSSAQTSKRNELVELEKVIGVFESNGIEKLFEGKLPTIQQVQGMVALGATPAGAVVAVEQALVALNKLLGGIQDGMRYSRLQDQRRTLQAQVNENRAEQDETKKRASQVSSYLESLSTYTPLFDMRLEWLAENKKIYMQLKAEREKLRS
ncbi:MAG: alpha-xenorhabdolysin family binary toxin subunit B, partial [Hafnia sp.]